MTTPVGILKIVPNIANPDTKDHMPIELECDGNTYLFEFPGPKWKRHIERVHAHIEGVPVMRENGLPFMVKNRTWILDPDGEPVGRKAYNVPSIAWTFWNNSGSTKTVGPNGPLLVRAEDLESQMDIEIAEKQALLAKLEREMDERKRLLLTATHAKPNDPERWPTQQESSGSQASSGVSSGAIRTPPRNNLSKVST